MADTREQLDRAAKIIEMFIHDRMYDEMNQIAMDFLKEIGRECCEVPLLQP